VPTTPDRLAVNSSRAGRVTWWGLHACDQLCLFRLELLVAEEPAVPKCCQALDLHDRVGRGWGGRDLRSCGLVVGLSNGAEGPVEGIGLTVAHRLDVGGVPSGEDLEGFAGHLLADRHRRDHVEVELLERLAAEALLEEEDPFIGEYHEALFALVLTLTKFVYVFAVVQQVPQVAEFFAAEETAGLPESLSGGAEPTVVEELVTDSLDDVRRDLRSASCRLAWRPGTQPPSRRVPR